MRATQSFVASTQSTLCPTPSDCPSLEEMWACVEGERSHEEVSRVIQHCSSCAPCAERWRKVCEQSVDGEKPDFAGQEATPVSSAASDAPAGASPHQPKARTFGDNLDNMAHRYDDEHFARPNLVPWAIGAGVVLIAVFWLLAS